MSDYLIVVNNSEGKRGGVIDAFSSLELAFSEMSVGVLRVQVPSVYFNHRDFGLDDILIVQRKVEGSGYADVAGRVWFLREWQEDSKTLTLTAYDQLYILDSRIIAYAAGTTYARKSGNAGNVMKAIIRENLGSSATDTARQISGLNVQADANDGASVSFEFSRDNVLAACRKIADGSIQAGSYISFDLEYMGSGQLEFRTYPGQRGENHGLGSGNPFIFSENFGNLVNAKIVENRKDERTYIYAGGQGEGENRAIGTASSADVNLSKWNRRERFWDGRNTTSPTVLANEAASELYENRPRKVFTGEARETEGTRFGIDYGYGDVVIMEGFGYSTNARISTVHIKVDDRGEETLTVKLRSEW